MEQSALSQNIYGRADLYIWGVSTHAHLYPAAFAMRFGISVLSIFPVNRSEPAPIAKTGTYPAVWLEQVHPTIAIWLITFLAAAAKGSVLA